jgi:hypothetical protein
VRTPAVLASIRDALGFAHAQLEKQLGVAHYTIFPPCDLAARPVLRVVVEYGEMQTVKTVEYELPVVAAP